MAVKRATALKFLDQPDELRNLAVSLHPDNAAVIVLAQDGDEVWIARADFAEIARQISEWEAGEPA